MDLSGALTSVNVNGLAPPMNKVEERNLFDLLYRLGRPWQVVPSEAPDFVCTLEGQSILGVEITELFADQTSARLRKIPGYARELTEQRRFRHPDDKAKLRFEEVILDPNGPNVQKVTAILPPPTNLREGFERLSEDISKKEAKRSRYECRCSNIDLVINDATGLLHIDDAVGFYFALTHGLDRLRIVNSPFREIFVLTTRDGRRRVAIPLKLNFLSQDFELFTKVLSDSKGFLDVQWRNEYFLWLAKCLFLSGYKQIQLAPKEDGAAIILGCWAIGKWRDAKRVANYVCAPQKLPDAATIGADIDDFIEFPNKDVSTFLRKRKRLACCFPFFLPV